MIRRFQDPDKVVEEIQRQRIVCGNRDIAEQLAAGSQLLEFPHNPPSNELISQDGADNDLFLILAGRVSVSVSGRELAIRNAGQHVGEMALIDASARRCATARAIETTVVAKIQERVFSAIANKHPMLWRNIALELAERLRERNRFVTQPNPRPVVFIGSSKESLEPAREIQAGFSHDDWVTKLWTDGFGPSATTIENLERELRGADFAILVLAADDLGRVDR
jgi:CRP-like cAMP-binding protein